MTLLICNPCVAGVRHNERGGGALDCVQDPVSEATVRTTRGLASHTGPSSSTAVGNRAEGDRREPHTRLAHVRVSSHKRTPSHSSRLASPNYPSRPGPHRGRTNIFFHFFIFLYFFIFFLFLVLYLLRDHLFLIPSGFLFPLLWTVKKPQLLCQSSSSTSFLFLLFVPSCFQIEIEWSVLFFCRLAWLNDGSISLPREMFAFCW